MPSSAGESGVLKPPAVFVDISIYPFSLFVAYILQLCCFWHAYLETLSSWEIDLFLSSCNVLL